LQQEYQDHQLDYFLSGQEFGESIATQVLEDDSYLFLYKPHPATGSTCSQEKMVNEKIVEMVNESERGLFVSDYPINDIFGTTDIAIFDNSSVVIDFLKEDKPFLITDMFSQDQNSVELPVIANASKLLKVKELPLFAQNLKSELANDTLKSKRNEIKEYYIGNYAEGEATNNFITQIDKIINEWNSINSSKNNPSSTLLKSETRTFQG